MDTSLVLAAMTAFAMVAITTTLHHHVLRLLGRLSSAHRLSRFGVVVFLTALVSVHMVQISLYAGAYWLGACHLGMGDLHVSRNAGLNFFYFAAETYSTLGNGDIVPNGALRLLASVEPLNGLLLLAWSGAFLFGVLDAQGHHA